MKRFDWSEFEYGGRVLALSLVLSVLLHLLILVFGVLTVPEAHKRPARPLRVEFRSLTKAQWKNLKPPKSALAKRNTKVRTPKEQRKPKPPETKLPQGQVVDLAPPEQEQTPDHARFLSSYNTKVKKETQSRFKAIYDQPAPRPSPVALRTKEHPKPKPKPKSKEISITETQKPQEEKRQKGAEEIKLQLRKNPPKSALKLEESPEGTRQNTPKQKVVSNAGWSDHTEVVLSKGSKGKDEKNQEKRAGFSPEELALISVAGGPMADYLEDIEEADETALNSKAFKYATFFNRVKREVARNWHPGRVHRRYDPYFTIYGYQDRRTIVYVTLDSEGNVEKVEVIEPSGVDFLDDEAVAAIYRASPFPNPPRGLIDKDGKVRFPFGFYFQISSVKFRPLFSP